MVQRISNTIGSVQQGMAYSTRTNRIFIIFDNAFMSLPESKLNKKMALKDMSFTVLKSSFYRESEGMGITGSGRGYMVFNRVAETAQSKGSVK